MLNKLTIIYELFLINALIFKVWIKSFINIIILQSKENIILQTI
jgi:hypothetical protein